jgi:hypothetical protein
MRSPGNAEWEKSDKFMRSLARRQSPPRAVRSGFARHAGRHVCVCGRHGGLWRLIPKIDHRSINLHQFLIAPKL